MQGHGAWEGALLPVRSLFGTVWKQRYAKKARLEDIDLLKKEKSREKKLRKEKKDKEKRESKEKKHKDRSEEKHRENKEKKVKNKDKRNDKDKDKDTKTASDENRLLGKSENLNGGNLARKEHKVDDSILFEKTHSGQSAAHARAKLIEDSHQAEKTRKLEPMHDAGNRIKDKEGGKFSATQSERDDKMVRMVARGSATSMEVVEKIKGHKVDDSKVGRVGIREDAKFSTIAMAQNPAATVRTGVDVVSKAPPLGKKDSKPSEKKTEGWKETKEEIKEGDSNEKRKEKHKDKDREKKVKTKDKNREKEKKKEEKKPEKLDDRRGEMNASNESNKEKSISSHTLKPSQLPVDGDKSVTVDGNSKKRKDLETNGFLHTDDVRPVKFQKLTSSAHPNPGNGRILGPCQTSTSSAMERQGTANNLKSDSKERKINGVIVADPSASSIKPTPTRLVDQMALPPPKPPHPDCRFFSQIYSFPKVEEWSDFCDQEWLSKSVNALEKKPKSSDTEETPLVWAEAFRIESADICALPYVIPY